MYQTKTQLMKKVLLASTTLAVASLFTTVPASGCAVSGAAKTKSAAGLAPGAGAMALSAALNMDSAPQTSTSKPKAEAFVGLWDLKIYSQGQLFDEGFDTFHSDGTELLITQDNPITENVCPGVWEQTGPATIKVKHPSWYFDTSGNLLGSVIIYETLTLDCDDSFHGTSLEVVYDTQGNKLGSYESQLTGTRIKVS
jgi:hypothetical protein